MQAGPWPNANPSSSDFYDDYEARVRAAPADHGMGYVHAYLTIAKV